MSSDLVFIHDDVLSDVADAIRFVEGSSAGIAPEDYADHIKALDNRILQPNVLNFYMPNGGTVSLNKTGSPTEVELEYWLDDNGRWIVWQPDNNGNRSLVLRAGQRMYVRNTSETQTGFSTSADNWYKFAFTDTVEAHGNTNSLLCKNAESVTSLSVYCYFKLFSGCTSLVTAPELPATTLNTYCYYQMFFDCLSLVITPDLPATIMVNRCYADMFRLCSQVKEIRTQMTDITAAACIKNWLFDVSAQGDFYCPASLTIPVGASGIPSGWTRHNYEDELYLNFTMPNGGDITLTKTGSPAQVTLEYLLEGTPNWVTWTETNNVRTLTLTAGQKVYIRNASETSTRFSTLDVNCYKFSFSADTYAGGDLRSLVCKTPSNASSAGSNFCFYGLFMNATNLIKANIKLLFTDLPRSFYRSMFEGCSNLIEVPETITATTCSGVQPCYRMFYGCSKITKLPKLTLLRLSDYAYGSIAASCINLNYVYTEMTDISTNTGTVLAWLYNVSPTGDLYCPAELTIPTGESGIPSGWTRHDI